VKNMANAFKNMAFIWQKPFENMAFIWHQFFQFFIAFVAQRKSFWDRK
jgi:hypothetical protein